MGAGLLRLPAGWCMCYRNAKPRAPPRHERLPIILGTSYKQLKCWPWYIANPVAKAGRPGRGRQQALSQPAFPSWRRMWGKRTQAECTSQQPSRLPWGGGLGSPPPSKQNSPLAHSMAVCDVCCVELRLCRVTELARPHPSLVLRCPPPPEMPC